MKHDLKDILPNALIEIIKECVSDYAKKENINPDGITIHMGFINSFVEPKRILPYNMGEIQDVIFEKYDIDASIYHPTRKREILEKRQLVQFMMCSYSKATLEGIGSVTGDKGHATILNSKKTINELIDTDKEFKREVREVDNLIRIKLGLNKSKVFSNK